jgi:hypothetical protein
MHMMFVDESGDPGYPPNGNWEEWGGSRQFARVGTVIHGWKWKSWNTRLLQFKHNRGLTWDAEIKASHVRRGRGAFVGWEEDRRRMFLADLVTLIGQNVDISLLGVLIDKTRIDLTQRDRLVRPEVRSLELLLERYNLFLRCQQDRSGIVILDPVKESSDDNLRRFQSFLQAQSANLQPLHIVESTFFAKSHTSNMVQVADICTNMFYRQFSRPDGSGEFRQLQKRFWSRNGRVSGYGIKKWPA